MPIQIGVTGKETTDMTVLQARLRTQKESPVEVVSSCLKRIERLNPRLNAVTGEFLYCLN